VKNPEPAGDAGLADIRHRLRERVEELCAEYDAVDVASVLAVVWLRQLVTDGLDEDFAPTTSARTICASGIEAERDEAPLEDDDFVALSGVGELCDEDVIAVNELRAAHMRPDGYNFDDADVRSVLAGLRGRGWRFAPPKKEEDR
jgi:hypothetical protein